MQSQRIQTVLTQVAAALRTASNGAQEMMILANQRDVEWWRNKAKEWLLLSHVLEQEVETK